MSRHGLASEFGAVSKLADPVPMPPAVSPLPLVPAPKYISGNPRVSIQAFLKQVFGWQTTRVGDGAI